MQTLIKYSIKKKQEKGTNKNNTFLTMLSHSQKYLY